MSDEPRWITDAINTSRSKGIAKAKAMALLKKDRAITKAINADSNRYIRRLKNIAVMRKAMKYETSNYVPTCNREAS